jgi:hypothetical protein
MRLKKRANTGRGERHGHVKLTWEEVHEIRRLYAPGEGFHNLAQKFGVHHTTVFAIVKERTWVEKRE